MSNFWDKNPEIAQQIFKLWKDGMPAAHILMELGLANELSRSAILGRVHREKHKLARVAGAEGKNRRSIFLSPKAPPRPVSRAYPRLPPRPHAYRERILNVLDETTKVHLIDAERHHCRWVLGEPADGWFCGATIAPEARLPYCPYHQVLIYRPDISYSRKTYARNYRR